jgi:hypothetical protein
VTKQTDQEPSRAGAAYPSRSWKREESTAELAAFEMESSWATSQRTFSREHKVPRTTLQYWMERKAMLDASPAEIGFFESPAGLLCLHRLLSALHFVFGFLGPSGLRMIMQVVELSRLRPFVANSFGSHQKLAVGMEKQICTYGVQEQQRLAQQMPPKDITACQDETFHPAPCLVAIEPVSNFILLETYAKGRDAATWNEKFKAALCGLRVRVIQSTSDEGKGLLAHVRSGLGAHHSPDLFHGQQELSRATSIALAGQVRQAEQKAEDAAARVARAAEQARAWAQSSHGPGRPPNFEQRAVEAAATLDSAAADLEATRVRQERAHQAIRGIGQAYHPVDLKTGEPRSPAQVTQALEQHFATIATIANEAALPERCQQGIRKAHRLLPLFTSTLAFFHTEVRTRMGSLGLRPDIAEAVEKHLVAAAYLERAAPKARPADTRAPLRELAVGLRDHPQLVGALAALDSEVRARVERVASECADLFQRSSSCVEGRNGQLSLQHHGLHRISASRLQALTVVHNFFLRRPDGTTAAERFFGAKPADLFDRLLLRLPKPARPAASRSPTARMVN